MTDFSKTLIRASSVYGIMAGEGSWKTPEEKLQEARDNIVALEAKFESLKSKETKTALATLAKIEEAKNALPELELLKQAEPPPLTEGCKALLARLYAAEKYGKWSLFKDRGNKYTSKGKDAEADSIALVSALDRRAYVKNDVRIDNDYVSGVPDIIVGDSYDSIRYVIDVKTPYDMETFICNLGKPLCLQYQWQMQTYIWLTGAEIGEVSFCLVNSPAHLIRSEEYRLLDRMGVTTEEDPDYIEAKIQLVKNLTFDDMPVSDRRIKYIVERDEEAHAKIAKRVEKCREYLVEIEKLHLDAIEFAEFKEKEHLV
jgi:hypothetical protein